ncbi:MAG: DUF885 family protein, partial [Caulobacteraceae bacterium]|nr:DUF885 family protein [Caulobacteraceae bacterium]
MLDRRTFLAAGAAAGALASEGLAAATGEDARLGALFEAFIHDDFVRQPVEATAYGLDVGPLADLRGKVGDASLASVAADKRDLRDRVAKLKTIDRTALSPMGTVNLDTVAYVYGVQDEVNRRTDYGGADSNSPYELSQLTGAYQSAPDFLDTRQPVANASDAEAYLDRLAGFAVVLDQELEVARHDAALGVIPPDFIIERTLAQMRGLAATPASTSRLVNALA